MASAESRTAHGEGGSGGSGAARRPVGSDILISDMLRARPLDEAISPSVYPGRGPTCSRHAGGRERLVGRSKGARAAHRRGWAGSRRTPPLQRLRLQTLSTTEWTQPSAKLYRKAYREANQMPWRPRTPRWAG